MHLIILQVVTEYSPLTWGIYDEPPPDVPECGFLGELCPPAVQGKSSLAGECNMAVIIIVSYSKQKQ